MKAQSDKREQYKTTIGPLLKRALDKQKENVKKVAYDVVKASDWEAGEIIAKKVLESNLL